MSKNIVEVMELLYQVVTFSSLFHLYFPIFSNMIIVLSPVQSALKVPLDWLLGHLCFSEYQLAKPYSFQDIAWTDFIGQDHYK